MMNNLIMTMVKLITKSLEMLSDKWAGIWINKLFFSPHRKHKHTLSLNNMHTQWMDFDSTFGESLRCKVYSAGAGPTVLLVHGWEGSAYSYSILSNELVKAGFRVVLCDFPAHGQSSGNKTNLEELQRIITTLSDQNVTLHAVIGHSFGAFATAYAIKLRLPIKHFVSISSPVDMDFIINSLCHTVGASNKSKKHLIASIESILQAPYESASVRNNVFIKKINGLIIHDQHDKIVPYDHAKALTSLWPSATLMSTSGLGHSRILKDQTVINRVIDYLKGIQ